MAITLCLDFGNTRKKCAVFENDKIIDRIIIDDNANLNQVIEKYTPQKSILSSVINNTEELESLLLEHTQFHKLTNYSKLPFTTPVAKPETIGSDRLALAAAATTLYPGINILVIGLGSCITYNFINKIGAFIGGSISPGMEMRFQALNAYTAKLPLVRADWNFPLIGYDTRTNILSGVLFGICKEIEGVIDEYQNRFRNFNVLLTGGDGAYFARHLKRQIFADPDLIFKGLYAISEFNDDGEM